MLLAAIKDQVHTRIHMGIPYFAIVRNAADPFRPFFVDEVMACAWQLLDSLNLYRVHAKPTHMHGRVPFYGKGRYSRGPYNGIASAPRNESYLWIKLATVGFEVQGQPAIRGGDLLRRAPARLRGVECGPRRSDQGSGNHSDGQ